MKLLQKSLLLVLLAYNLPGFRGELKLTSDILNDMMNGEIQRWDDSRLLEWNPHLIQAAKLQPEIRIVQSGDANTIRQTPGSIGFTDDGSNVHLKTAFLLQPTR